MVRRGVGDLASLGRVPVSGGSEEAIERGEGLAEGGLVQAGTGAVVEAEVRLSSRGGGAGEVSVVADVHASGEQVILQRDFVALPGVRRKGDRCQVIGEATGKPDSC